MLWRTGKGQRPACTYADHRGAEKDRQEADKREIAKSVEGIYDEPQPRPNTDIVPGAVRRPFGLGLSFSRGIASGYHLLPAHAAVTSSIGRSNDRQENKYREAICTECVCASYLIMVGKQLPVVWSDSLPPRSLVEPSYLWLVRGLRFPYLCTF